MSATIINISRLNIHLATHGQLLHAPDLITRTFGSTTNATPAPAQRPDPDGTHVNPSNGLMWSTATTASGKTWAEAKEAAEAVRLGGFTDWRLPTIQELLTLVDYGRCEPAINTDIFECELNWYWSATPYASSPSVFAWLVLFGGGSADYLSQSYRGRVRAVRSVSPAASGQ